MSNRTAGTNRTPTPEVAEPRKPREAYNLTPTVEALDEFHREATSEVERVMAMLLAAFEDGGSLTREEKDQILPALWAALQGLDDVKDVVKALKVGGIKAALAEVEQIRVERRKAERANNGGNGGRKA